MVFENPANGYREECSVPWLWCFLFGSLYFIFKGIWSHAVVFFIAAILTSGFSLFVYPFFANGAVVKHYEQKGWKRVA